MFTRNEIRVSGAAALIVLALSAGCASSPQARETKYLKKGELLLAKKDYSRALLEFKNAANAMPGDAEPYYRIGLAYMQSNSLAEAAGAFRKATELNPKHQQAQLKLAALLTASRNKDLLEQAVSRLKGISSPGSPEASDTLAVAELELGKRDDAASLLERVLQEFPADLRASVNLSRLKLARKDPDGAEEVLRKAVDSAPRSPQAALALAQLYMLLGQPGKAEPEIRRAIDLDAKNGAALTALAALQAGSNRLDEAEMTYHRLAALPDKRYRPLHAVFLFQTGKASAALAEFEKLAKEDPSDRGARGRLVAAYLKMSRTAEARTLLANALKENPKDVDALFQQSQLDLRAGKLVEAERGLEQVMHLEPDSAEAHFALAAVFGAKGQRGAERQELNEAVRLKPKATVLRLALARNLTAANEGNAALGVLDQAPAEQKNLPAVVAERNWALLSLGRNQDVEDALGRITPSAMVGDLELQKAVVELRRRKYSAARISAEEVLKQDPDSVRAAAVVMQSYDGEGRTGLGLTRLAEIAAARPQSAPLHYLLGQWRLSGGDKVAATQAFEAAKSADAAFLPADLALAEVERGEHRLDSARQRLIGAVAAYPNSAAALIALAGIEKDSGDQPSASATYRSALVLDSSNTAALSGLACLLAEDDPAAALGFAQKAGEFAPNDPGVQDCMGRVYYRKGLYSAAANYLKSALAQAPTAQRQFHLAMAYLKSGERAEGERILAEALRKDPNLPSEEHGW